MAKDTIKSISDEFRALMQSDEGLSSTFGDVKAYVNRLVNAGMDLHAAVHTVGSISLQEGIFEDEGEEAFKETVLESQMSKQAAE